MPYPQLPVTLTNKQRISSNTMELEFHFINNEGFNFQAGQFVQLAFEYQGKHYKRSYSIANSPESFYREGSLAIAISFVKEGIASSFFNTIPIGSQIALTGPFGVLTLPQKLSGQLVLVGTGTGIAPYHAMIPNLINLATPSTPIIILMGGRHQDDVIYKSDFQEVTKTHPHIDYCLCLSRENASSLKKGEHSGYVQQQLNHLDLQIETDSVYLCGNPYMVDDAVSRLKIMGFGHRQIKREKYVYSGH